MPKNILNLNGAQKLSKNDQLAINGGCGKSCTTAFCQGCESLSEYWCCIDPNNCD